MVPEYVQKTTVVHSVYVFFIYKSTTVLPQYFFKNMVLNWFGHFHVSNIMVFFVSRGYAL